MKNVSVSLLSLLGFFLLTSLTPAYSQEQSPAVALRDSVPSLNASGSAEISLPADEMRISLGVVTEHADATQALRQNSRQMNAVVEALQAAGLEKKEYETGQFQISPRYSRRPQQASADWTPQITLYSVTNSLNIKTSRIDLAGELIQGANAAGANTINSISFGLSDHRAGREEAISAATFNALQDAKVLAEAAGLRLGRVLSISVDDAYVDQPMRNYGMKMDMAMSTETASPPVEAGEISVRATVRILYEVNSGN